MSLSKKLKLIISSLIAGSFMVFGKINAMETVNQINVDVKRTDLDKKGHVLFTRANGEVDSNCYFNCVFVKQHEISGFQLCFICYRLQNGNSVIDYHPLIKIYRKSSNNLKYIIKKQNGEKVIEGQIYYNRSMLNNNNVFVDYFELNLNGNNIISLENGFYNIELYNNNELLGSFKNVKLNNE